MSDKNYNLLIEDYLSGQLSRQDKASFEQELRRDPALKSELEIQKDILKVISDARRTELKTMLNHTHIGWYHMIPGSVKTGVIISAITIAGLSGYLWLKPEKTDLTEMRDDPTEFTVQENQSTDVIQPVPEGKVEQETSIDQSMITEIHPDATIVQDKNNSQAPDIFVPEPVIDQEENALALEVPEDIRKDALNPTVDNSTIAIHVQLQKNKKFDFHYQFVEGELILFGEFDQTPYEILEVNQNQTKLFYLFFSDTYYELKANTLTPSPLLAITDLQHIATLNILREKN